jgi:hypothetical protein
MVEWEDIKIDRVSSQQTLLDLITASLELPSANSAKLPDLTTSSFVANFFSR